jgi:hypothetical protein
MRSLPTRMGSRRVAALRELRGGDSALTADLPKWLERWNSVLRSHARQSASGDDGSSCVNASSRGFCLRDGLSVPDASIIDHQSRLVDCELRHELPPQRFRSDSVPKPAGCKTDREARKAKPRCSYRRRCPDCQIEPPNRKMSLHPATFSMQRPLSCHCPPASRMTMMSMVSPPTQPVTRADRSDSTDRSSSPVPY